MSYDSKEKRREYARQYYHNKLKSKLSIAKIQKKPLIDSDIIDSYMSGKSTLKLSDEYGVDKTIIRRILIKNNVEMRDNRKLCSERNGKDNPNYNGYEGITGTKWASIKEAATRRNIEFSITKEEVWQLYIDQKGLCALSGLPIIFASNVKEHIERICTASLDRIDSTIGYKIDNVQWVHKDVNLMKMNLEESKFIELCSLIAKYKGYKN